MPAWVINMVEEGDIDAANQDEAIAAYIAARRDADGFVRWSAARALHKIGTEEALAAVWKHGFDT